MFPENLKSLRMEKKMTQEEMADAMHVSRQTYVRWEAGHVEPSLQNLRQISEYFDVTTDALLLDGWIENVGNIKVPPKGKHSYGLVTIDEELRITLPKQACRQFDLHPGDRVLVLGDEAKGIGIFPPYYFLTQYRNMTDLDIIEE